MPTCELCGSSGNDVHLIPLAEGTAVCESCFDGLRSCDDCDESSNELRRDESGNELCPTCFDEATSIAALRRREP